MSKYEFKGMTSMGYDVKFAHEQSHVNMIQQTLFKKRIPNRQKTSLFSASIEQCVLSPAHFNLHLEALGKNMIVLSDVVSRTRVILVCL